MKSSTAQDNSNLKVTVFWGDILYDTAICRPRESVTIGSKPSDTFVLDLDRNMKLMDVHSGRRAVLHFDDDLDGHIRIGKELLSLQSAKDTKHVTKDKDGKYRVELSENDKADIVIGHVSMYFDWVGDGELLPRSPIFDKKNTMFLLILLLICGGVLALVQFIGVPEVEKPPERLVLLEPHKVKSTAVSPTPSDAAPSKAAMGKPKTQDGGAQKGAAGKVATAVPDKPSAAASLRKANLGSLVGGLTQVGANAPSTNPDAAAVQAPVKQAGTGGFTTVGMDTGGGGKSVGIGRTVGQGEGGFSGTGRLGLYGNSSVDGAGSGGGGGLTTVGGGLDRDVIESIIKRRLDRIRLCYERQLNFFPKLAGKVTVHFTIGKTGSVLTSGIVEDTMKNTGVHSCIQAEVKTWSFPAPEGGTIVSVDYPFVFESTAKNR